MDQSDELMFDKFKCVLHELTKEKIDAANLRKPQLVDWVLHFADMYHKTKKFILSEISKIEELNDKVIQNQEKIISLQEQLISSKDEQLASFQTTVRDEMASVQTTVKSELCSWSDVVKQNTFRPITSAKLKEAVKSAVVEEDRSRNVMIFGKPDVENEDLSSKVSDIFADLQEKPQLVECRRIGAAKSGKCRPIKVKLSSSEAVSYVLTKAKILRASKNNRATYITADRSEEERGLHKKLVDRVKLKIKEEPDMYHFIKGGLISSVRRRTSSQTASTSET